MATTLTVDESTRRRLADYRQGDDSFDDVLNKLMDRVPLEEIAVETLQTHYRRLANFRPGSVNKMRERLLRRLARTK